MQLPEILVDFGEFSCSRGNWLAVGSVAGLW